MTRTFWLSFADEDGHRGCCVIDVDESDAARVKPEMDHRFPNHAEGAEWLAAATRKAWSVGCNPGGEVGSCEIPPEVPVPRNTLLVGAELERWARPPAVH